MGLADCLLELFFDREHGGFYPYASDGEQLLTRTKEAYDGAMPSGNAMAALVLSRLARITGEGRWREAAELQLSWLAGAAPSRWTAYQSWKPFCGEWPSQNEGKTKPTPM